MNINMLRLFDEGEQVLHYLAVLLISQPIYPGGEAATDIQDIAARDRMLDDGRMTERRYQFLNVSQDIDDRPIDVLGRDFVTPFGVMHGKFAFHIRTQIWWQSVRSEEHTSELQSHSFISYAVF